VPLEDRPLGDRFPHLGHLNLDGLGRAHSTSESMTSDARASPHTRGRPA
jgi:hypothetical protein